MKKCQIKYFVWFIVLVCWCQSIDEPTSENLNQYLNQQEINLLRITYGPLGSENTSKIRFVKSDSVDVFIYSFGLTKPSRKLKIGNEDFDEITSGIKCLCQSNLETKLQSNSLKTPKIQSYYLVSATNKMKLLDSENKCNFKDILRDKLDYPNLLDMISEFG